MSIYDKINVREIIDIQCVEYVEFTSDVNSATSDVNPATSDVAELTSDVEFEKYTAMIGIEAEFV